MYEIKLSEASHVATNAQPSHIAWPMAIYPQCPAPGQLQPSCGWGDAGPGLLRTVFQRVDKDRSSVIIQQWASASTIQWHLGCLILWLSSQSYQCLTVRTRLVWTSANSQAFEVHHKLVECLPRLQQGQLRSDLQEWARASTLRFWLRAV